MSAISPKRDAVLIEIESKLKEKNREIEWKKSTTWGKIIGWITMTTSKIKESSSNSSIAIIGLILAFLIQTVVVVWWAAKVSGSNEQHEKDIQELRQDMKSVLGEQKVYIDNTREKFIKMEAIIEGMRNEKQLEDLLLRKKAEEREK